MSFGYFLKTPLNAFQYLNKKCGSCLLLFSIFYIIFLDIIYYVDLLSGKLWPYALLSLKIIIFCFLIYIVVYTLYDKLFCIQSIFVDIITETLYIESGLAIYQYALSTTSVFYGGNYLELNLIGHAGKHKTIRLKRERLAIPDIDKLRNILCEMGCTIIDDDTTFSYENQIEKDWIQYQRRECKPLIDELTIQSTALMLKKIKQYETSDSGILYDQEAEKINEMLEKVYDYYEGRTDVKPDILKFKK